MDPYEIIQFGEGGGDIGRGVGRIYAGSRFQRGHGGIGSFLAGLFRSVLPIVRRGAKTVGKEALKTGLNIMSDVATRNTPIKESFRERIRESGKNLKRKAEEKLDKLMEGSGYNPACPFDPLQLSTGSRNVRKRRKFVKVAALKKKNKKKSRKNKPVKKQIKKKNKSTPSDIFN